VIRLPLPSIYAYQREFQVSPTVELDDEVYGFLKCEAEPFVDTPNSVLRRLLGIDSTASRPPAASAPEPAASTTHAGMRVARRSSRPKSTKAGAKRTRAASGTLLPEERYERPLLEALADAGGRAPYRDVVDAVGRELKDQLMPADFEKLSSGTIRWQSRLQFVRLRLIQRGHLDKNAPRGVWTITDQGREALREGEGS